MKQLKLDISPHYGKLARLTQEQIIEQIDSLISAGELRLLPGQYPTVVLAKPASRVATARPSVSAPQEKPPVVPATNVRTTPNQTVDPLRTPDSGLRTPIPNPQLSIPNPSSPFTPLPVAVGWAILRVVEGQDGELPRSGVVHFLRGTTDLGTRSTSSRTTLPGFRFLVQYPHQELLRAVDLLVERKLLVVEATEHLHLWLTQRGKAALEAGAKQW